MRLAEDTRRKGAARFFPGLAAAFFASLSVSLAAAQSAPGPERVSFMSADGKAELIGYLFVPAKPKGTRTPAIVMMHGRGGAYSSAAKGRYDASTLSRRHQAWGTLWADEGYVAILVDGFGPRGYPHGFPRFSYDTRPTELSEVTVRPLDAYGALAYLRTRDDVAPDRIGLQGWSNGASATLAAMSTDVPNLKNPTPATGFRAALAFYPACGLKGKFDAGYRPYAPVRVFMGTADEEVSSRRCADLVDRSIADGGDITIRLYKGAAHGFDDPGRKRQSVAANARAKDDAETRAREFFAQQLGQPQRR
jgi:carboxymethylenebutenolidase